MERINSKIQLGNRQKEWASQGYAIIATREKGGEK